MKSSTIISSLSLALAMSIPGAHAAAPYKTVEVADGGTVSGKVTFSGDDPAPKMFAITKDNDVCGSGNREVDFVKVNGGALTDVVVYLDKVKEGKAFDAAAETGAVNQKGCAFDPFIQIMHNGNDFTATNSDAVSHNIHTYEILGRAKKTVFNISQPDQGDIKKTVKLKRGTAMKVECDQHDFMHGFVFVAKSPYYALVAEDGSYTIEGVPSGKYTIKAWHGTLKEQKASVEVAAGGSVSADFAFTAK